MDPVRILIGLLLAVVVYVVLTAFIHFAQAALVFGVLAVLIFLWVAFGAGAGPGIRRRW